MRSFRSKSVPFCFARQPFSVTNGAFKRADLFHHITWCTQADKIHWDSSFNMTPEWTFYGHSHSHTSRADHSLCLQTFHSTSGHFLPHERTVFITCGTLPAARAGLLRLRGPLARVPRPFSFSSIPVDIFGSLSLRM